MLTPFNKKSLCESAFLIFYRLTLLLLFPSEKVIVRSNHLNQKISGDGLSKIPEGLFLTRIFEFLLKKEQCLLGHDNKRIRLVRRLIFFN